MSKARLVITAVTIQKLAGSSPEPCSWTALRQWVSAFDEEVADVGQQQGDGGQDEQGCHGRAPVACGGPDCQKDHSGHGSQSDQASEESR